MLYLHYYFKRTEGSRPWDVHRVVPGHTDVSFLISKKRPYNCVMYNICIIISTGRADRAHEMFIESYQVTQTCLSLYPRNVHIIVLYIIFALLFQQDVRIAPMRCSSSRTRSHRRVFPYIQEMPIYNCVIYHILCYLLNQQDRGIAPI